MSYHESSEWNDLNELRCLEIFLKLKEAGFRRGKQIELCRKMSLLSNLDVGNISAKVCNYKSVAGVNNPSKASENTILFYKRFGHLSSTEVGVLVKNAMAGQNIV